MHFLTTLFSYEVLNINSEQLSSCTTNSVVASYFYYFVGCEKMFLMEGGLIMEEYNTLCYCSTACS